MNAQDSKNTGTSLNVQQKNIVSISALTAAGISTNTASVPQNELVIRISEIEIYPELLNEYKAILKEEAEASVRIESGVISIFPMYQKEDCTQIRILEIYADKESYQEHLKTPHFQKYKTTTFHMVKSLKLTEMNTIDRETMTAIFKKLKN